MRLLLDTHSFIWFDSEPARLSAAATSACIDPSNTLILSTASVWEMEIKSALGKLTLKKPLSDLIDSHQRINKLAILPIQLSHVYELSNLPLHHRDPFDRMLIAQARTEELVIVTADRAFSLYTVDTLDA
ncbi:MAG TPA: type II toxin-antitoxin system VapC family toxin [Chthonomonadales bacterium]|nr:type II toxin-antitoxin system VapC family toxin [Chthonomonadales bacterium]